ncbi:MAG: transposase, partial [Erysipelothrix sp.]|nr:transposase [Erysipelothrix sp.]
MYFESRSHYSGHLNREMYFNVYGHAGKPMVVFP